jgi:hypothetical protein
VYELAATLGEHLCRRISARKSSDDRVVGHPELLPALEEVAEQGAVEGEAEVADARGRELDRGVAVGVGSEGARDHLGHQLGELVGEDAKLAEHGVVAARKERSGALEQRRAE